MDIYIYTNILTMEKDVLKKLIDDGLSLNKISKNLNKSLTTIRYWAKKYNLISSHKTFKEKVKKEPLDYRYCPSCKEKCKIEDFYRRRNIPNSSTYCKKCTTNQTLKRTQKLKKLMVEYKGNSCSICGYNKYLGALEFHHLDPKNKDFTPSKLKRYTFDDKVKIELDKCILVCANCHREIHGKVVVPQGFEPR